MFCIFPTLLVLHYSHNFVIAHSLNDITAGPDKSFSVWQNISRLDVCHIKISSLSCILMQHKLEKENLSTGFFFFYNKHILVEFTALTLFSCKYSAEMKAFF